MSVDLPVLRLPDPAGARMLAGVVREPGESTPPLPAVQTPVHVGRVHACDDCGGPCQGGCEDYLSITGDQRHGCADHQACARVWAVKILAR